MINTRTLRILGITIALSAATGYAASAKDNWDNLCAKCHAEDGSGSTKVGKKLKIKDYTDAKSLAKESDDQLAKDIANGVTKDGKEVMKGFKDELKPDEVKDLVALIRKMAKK